jgi:hypothetical protein
MFGIGPQDLHDELDTWTAPFMIELIKVMLLLKDDLTAPPIKQQADKHRSQQEFERGEFLRFQPYR